MDASPPFGKGTALSPKQLCLASIGGCTAMDVVSWLKKHKAEASSIRVELDAPVKDGYPATFTSVTLDFYVEGAVPAALVEEAVLLSQTKYCGVSAMIADSCPIHYRVHLNGAPIMQGQAKF
ncbi:MAG: OsmC family peroxiredoxin [Proteobacteria bacterium]|nr:MAG: OsmC family peroxiredoxin [Pseudomonadota bacterium]